MASRNATNRYEVTGPDVLNSPTYADAGPALSRSITYASKSELPDGTWYVRDGVTGEIVGYTERGTSEAGVSILTFRNHTKQR